MVTLHTHFTDTYEEKQSKFIAHLFPYDRYEEMMAALRAEHPKARHFVTAFRHLNGFDQIVEGCSDDGEPKGTSGKPTLAVLQGQELINVGIITVRYFGGTKLGTGGLVRAYSDAANMAIAAADLVTYLKEFSETVAMTYSDMGRVEYETQQLGLKIAQKRFETAEVLFELVGTREQLDAFYDAIKRLVRRIEA